MFRSEVPLRPPFPGCTVCLNWKLCSQVHNQTPKVPLQHLPFFHYHLPSLDKSSQDTSWWTTSRPFSRWKFNSSCWVNTNTDNFPKIMVWNGKSGKERASAVNKKSQSYFLTVGESSQNYEMKLVFHWDFAVSLPLGFKKMNPKTWRQGVSDCHCTWLLEGVKVVVPAIVFCFPSSPKHCVPTWGGWSGSSPAQGGGETGHHEQATGKRQKTLWLPLSPPRDGSHETLGTGSILNIWDIYWEKYLHWNGQIYILSDMLEAYVPKSSLRINFSGYMLKDYSC